VAAKNMVFITPLPLENIINVYCYKYSLSMQNHYIRLISPQTDYWVNYTSS